MKKFILLTMSLLLTACFGAATTIEAGEQGKILHNNGLEEGTRGPGTFRMDYCWSWEACPKLVRLQVNKSTADLTIDSLFLPKSNVDIRNVQVGIQFQVKSDKKSIEQIYREVRPVTVASDSGDSNRVMMISADLVYQTFLARKAPDAIVTALRGHTVDEVLTNVPEIAKYTKEMINKMLEDTPIEVTELGFPNGIGEVPEEVIKAKRRLFAVEEEKIREVKALEAEMQIEAQRHAVQRLRVENDVKNAKIADVNYETYVGLKTTERFADAAESGTSVALGGQFIAPGNGK